MKAQEIAKYLPYADNEKDYVLLTRNEYEALIKLASKYVQIHNSVYTAAKARSKKQGR